MKPSEPSALTPADTPGATDTAPGLASILEQDEAAWERAKERMRLATDRLNGGGEANEVGENVSPRANTTLTAAASGGTSATGLIDYPRREAGAREAGPGSFDPENGTTPAAGTARAVRK